MSITFRCDRCGDSVTAERSITGDCPHCASRSDEAVYYGTRGKGVAVVTIHQEGKPARTLNHIIHHSPTGLEWGYGGSGPADLALSLLTDACGRKIAWEWHQAFKWDVVAGLADSWTLKRSMIQDWVRRYAEATPVIRESEARRIAV